ncbi:MAG: hypothetical protein RL033_7173 [Pseudomonadota bacterium]
MSELAVAAPAKPTGSCVAYRVRGALLAAALTACSAQKQASDCVPSEPTPTDLFCTGLYAEPGSLRLAATALPYKPGVTFWSDGAEKQRYLLLPAGSQIDTSQMDAWTFPIGTKAWKEFRWNGAFVETRLFWKRGESDWFSGTYVWNAEQSEAVLNTSRQPLLSEDGYEIPTAKDCGKCHHGGSDSLLGVEAVSLGLPDAEGVTLASLAALGALSDPPSPLTISLPEDATGKAAAALGFLHVNCGVPCHSSRGLGEETQLVMRMRADQLWPEPVPVEQTDAFQATVGRQPTTASVAQQFPGAQRITPGTHDQSLVWLLSHRRGDYQMPPLVSHRVDETGTQELSEWIDALEH